jgi:hypothetical protein
LFAMSMLSGQSTIHPKRPVMLGLIGYSLVVLAAIFWYTYVCLEALLTIPITLSIDSCARILSSSWGYSGCAFFREIFERI